MLTQAISRGGEAVNNKLPKQGGECIVIMHAAAVVVVKQNKSSARLQNFAQQQFFPTTNIKMFFEDQL